MEKKTLLPLIVFVLAFSLKSSSQISFGFKGGVNFANMIEKDNSFNFSENYQAKLGLQLGITASYPLTEKLFLESGILFSEKGFKVDFNGLKIDTKINYFEVPLNAVFKYKMGTFGLFASAGPYLGYTISNEITASDNIYTDENGLATNLDKMPIGSYIKTFDFGMNFGAGIEVNNTKIGVQYGFSLGNMLTEEIDGSILQNKVWGLSIGQNFGNNTQPQPTQNTKDHFSVSFGKTEYWTSGGRTMDVLGENDVQLLSSSGLFATLGICLNNSFFDFGANDVRLWSYFTVEKMTGELQNWRRNPIGNIEIAAYRIDPFVLNIRKSNSNLSFRINPIGLNFYSGKSNLYQNSLCWLGSSQTWVPIESMGVDSYSMGFTVGGFGVDYDITPHIQLGAEMVVVETGEPTMKISTYSYELTKEVAQMYGLFPLKFRIMLKI